MGNKFRKLNNMSNGLLKKIGVSLNSFSDYKKNSYSSYDSVNNSEIYVAQVGSPIFGYVPKLVKYNGGKK